MGDFIDYYELLGVSPRASEELIKRAYRISAKDAHPDSGGSEANFILLQTAYETLTDKFKREQYDEIYKRIELLKYKNFNKTDQDEEKAFHSTNPDVMESNTFNGEESKTFREGKKRKFSWLMISIGLALLILLPEVYNNFVVGDDNVDDFYYEASSYESPVDDQTSNEIIDNLIDENQTEIGVIDTTVDSDRNEEKTVLNGADQVSEDGVPDKEIGLADSNQNVSETNSLDSQQNDKSISIETSSPQIEKFSLGSSKEEVSVVMGTPTKISSYINKWNYGFSSIDFDDNDKVSGWNNSDNNLQVHIANAEDGSTFTLGSSKAEVLKAMGTPTQISSYINKWNYEFSSIDFDDNDKVSGWNDFNNNLLVHVASAEDGFTFTLGSSKAEVLKSMGTPTQISSYINKWNYGFSSIDFDNNDRVSGWNNFNNNLKVK